MMQFFRKIRQNLLSAEKTSPNHTVDTVGKSAFAAYPTGSSRQAARYLKYAIGEFALVVNRILIALQIDKWNEGRKDLIKEHAILVQLEEDCQINLQQLDKKMQLRIKIITSGLPC